MYLQKIFEILFLLKKICRLCFLARNKQLIYSVLYFFLFFFGGNAPLKWFYFEKRKAVNILWNAPFCWILNIFLLCLSGLVELNRLLWDFSGFLRRTGNV